MIFFRSLCPLSDHSVEVEPLLAVDGFCGSVAESCSSSAEAIYFHDQI